MSLGDGLMLSAKELLANRQLHKLDEDAILLLSDGLPNRALYWEQDNSACSRLPVSNYFAWPGRMQTSRFTQKDSALMPTWDF